MKKNVIKENKVILEDGEPKIVFTEETESRGWVDIEEARSLLTASIKAYCEKLGMK